MGGLKLEKNYGKALEDMKKQTGENQRTIADEDYKIGIMSEVYREIQQDESMQDVCNILLRDIGSCEQSKMAASGELRAAVDSINGVRKELAEDKREYIEQRGEIQKKKSLFEELGRKSEYGNMARSFDEKIRQIENIDEAFACLLNNINGNVLEDNDKEIYKKEKFEKAIMELYDKMEEKGKRLDLLSDILEEIDLNALTEEIIKYRGKNNLKSLEAGSEIITNTVIEEMDAVLAKAESQFTLRQSASMIGLFVPLLAAQMVKEQFHKQKMKKKGEETNSE